jgi:TRAP-type C4-dicarboxylate transport system permease small subunit
MVSLTFGIRGADFREFPRPRMIRPLWSFINGLVCILLALTIISPIIPYGLKILFEAIQAPATISIPLPESYLYVALPLSGVIASVVTYVFYRKAVENAEEFLLKAEI